MLIAWLPTPDIGRIMIPLLRTLLTLPLLLLFVGCTGGAQPKPDWHSVPDVNIPAYSTFGWSDPARAAPVAILDTQVRDALRAELLKKGYTESTDAPDFLVNYETMEFESAKQSNPVRIGIGVGSWGGNVGGSVGTSTDVGGGTKVLQQNRVVIRALDQDGGREIWIGTTTTFEEHPDTRIVDKAIAGVMQGFPGRKVQ